MNDTARQLLAIMQKISDLAEVEGQSDRWHLLNSRLMAAWYGLDLTDADLLDTMHSQLSDAEELAAHRESQICDRTEPPDVPGWWWYAWEPDYPPAPVKVNKFANLWYANFGGDEDFGLAELRNGLWGRCPIPVTASGEE